jgi:hypothetical protein
VLLWDQTESKFLFTFERISLDVNDFVFSQRSFFLLHFKRNHFRCKQIHNYVINYSVIKPFFFKTLVLTQFHSVRIVCVCACFVFLYFYFLVRKR